MFVKLLFWFCLTAHSVWRNCTCSEGYVREVWWWFSSFCNKLLYYCTLPSRCSCTILPEVEGNKLVLTYLTKMVDVCVSAFCPTKYKLSDLPHYYGCLSFGFPVFFKSYFILAVVQGKIISIFRYFINLSYFGSIWNCFPNFLVTW